jgi:uncharacterized repeat protein (TIGR03803 family)
MLEDRRLLTVAVQTLPSFAGDNPDGGLTLVGSTLFGTASVDGGHGDGTIYSINPDGTGYQVVHSFGGASDGAAPVASLTLVGTTLFGTTSEGGADNDGTVFSMNENGSDFQVPHSFTDTATDGAYA